MGLFKLLTQYGLPTLFSIVFLGQTICAQEDSTFKHSWSIELEPAFSFRTGDEIETNNFFALGPLLQVNRQISDKFSVHSRLGALYTKRVDFELAGYTVGLGFRWHLNSYFNFLHNVTDAGSQVYLFTNYSFSNLGRNTDTFFTKIDAGHNNIFRTGAGVTLKIYRRWSTKLEYCYARESRSTPNPNMMEAVTSIIYAF